MKDKFTAAGKMRIIGKIRELFPLDLMWAWGSILLFLLLTVHLILEAVGVIK